jgi:hypothetical protein
METLLKLCKKLALPMLLYWCEKLHLLNLHKRKEIVMMKFLRSGVRYVLSDHKANAEIKN